MCLELVHYIILIRREGERHKGEEGEGGVCEWKEGGVCWGREREICFGKGEGGVCRAGEGETNPDGRVECGCGSSKVTDGERKTIAGEEVFNVLPRTPKERETRQK